jgi:SAM-dependent methyltransferase
VANHDEVKHLLRRGRQLLGRLWSLRLPRAGHREKTARWLRGVGVEIGALTQPIEGIQPIYVDKFPVFAGERCLADYYGDAYALPFHANSLDYVASSHVLEHTANPVKAICEWYRVLRPGGIIYLVVPDRRYTFDRYRPVTACEHLFEDYRRDVSDRDATHVDEHVDLLDWRRAIPDLPSERVAAERERHRALYHGELAAGREINIHFHTFEPATLLEFFHTLMVHPLTQLRLTVVDHAVRFPLGRHDGILLVARVHKRPEDEAEAATNEQRRRENPGFPLLSTARKLQGATAAGKPPSAD